jgi:ubiquinone/menaquinone biosynthesis C-methylase UbiE
MDDHERMKAYYDRRAPEYDGSILGLGEAVPPKDIAEDRAALLQATSSLPPGRVLDVGCGTGYLTAGRPERGVGRTRPFGRLALHDLPAVLYSRRAS